MRARLVLEAPPGQCRRGERRPATWNLGGLLVALTGWGTEEDQRKAAEAGFDVHLTKPVDLKAIETVLAKSPIGHSRR